jgi:hypothetical protein
MSLTILTKRPISLSQYSTTSSIKTCQSSEYVVMQFISNFWTASSGIEDKNMGYISKCNFVFYSIVDTGIQVSTSDGCSQM